jgi:peptide/nickel transport system ATP-binding protein
VGLVPRSAGEIKLQEVSLPPDLSRRSLEILRGLQMVFQNPEEALNPYLTIGESLSSPLMTLLGQSPGQAQAGVGRLLAAVRLPPAYAERRPGQLSGGEQQRVAIARAFASNPALLIGDEPVSSLDVSVQASILNLLNELQAEHGSSLLFISHNLAVVGYLADTVAVIYLGRLMQVSAGGHIFEPPYHPYTEALLSAIPPADPGAAQERVRLEGEVPSPMAVPPGCPFHTRCPRFLGDICVRETPPWRVEPETGKRIFCHIPLAELRAAQARLLAPEPSEHV